MDSKLALSSAAEMLRLPISGIAPFRIMAGPAYVLLKRNEKLIAVKRALDFFTAEELGKLAGYESLFFPSVAPEAIRFLEAATHLKRVLKSPGDELGLTPFELSSFCWKAVAPLWSPERELEMGLAVLMCEEFCEPLAAQVLLESREQDVAKYEVAVLSSAICVVLAVCLGYCEQAFLNRLRLRCFLRSMNGVRIDDGSGELGELIHLALQLSDSARERKRIALDASNTRAGEKLVQRLARFQKTTVPVAEATSGG